MRKALFKCVSIDQGRGWWGSPGICPLPWIIVNKLNMKRRKYEGADKSLAL
jgi:hypothetical protein